jgi:cysteine desulfurase/selenocysteine lyase
MDIAAQNNCVIEFINFDPKTFLPQLNKTSSFENVSILSVMSSSNVIGGFWKNDFADLKKLIQKARSCGTKVIIDASQTILHSKLNMQSLGADFLFFSPHKSLGPMGLGVLYVSQSNQNLFDNGFGLIESSEKGIAWWENFELENIAYNKIMAVKQSFLFMAEQLDYAKQKKHIANLCSQLISFLEKFSNVVILGNLKQMKISGYIVSFYVKKIASHDIASFLAQEKIAVRAGHHCSQPMHNSLGISSSLRVSFAFYNDVEDVNKFQIAFDSAIKFFNQKGLLCNV